MLARYRSGLTASRRLRLQAKLCWSFSERILWSCLAFSLRKQELRRLRSLLSPLRCNHRCQLLAKTSFAAAASQDGCGCLHVEKLLQGMEIPEPCFSSGPKAQECSQEFPELAKAFSSGNKQQQREVLQKYIENGHSLESVEASFVATHELSEVGHKKRKLLMVKQMTNMGCSKIHVLADFFVM